MLAITPRSPPFLPGLACLRNNGHGDDVDFIGVDFDIEVLQGAIKTFHVRPRPYADPVRMINIYYNKGSSKDWQRMVCCKELIHLLDPEWAQTGSVEAINHLAAKIGLPPEMQNPVEDGVETNLDRMAEWRAAAILLPMSARKVMMPYYQTGVLTLADIARQADMPTKYAGLVMHEIWDKLYPLLAGLAKPNN